MDETAMLGDAEAARSGSVTFGPEDRGFVYAVARRIVGCADDAEDVTQEALLLAYRHRDSFRGDARYRTWLYRIAATTALGHLRRQRRTRQKLVRGERAGDVAERHADPPSAMIERAEVRAVVQRALIELAPPYREVLLARAEASDHEVASKLGISIANVKIRAHRARKQLRAALDRIAKAAA
jgi:RNA polymerase sigma-70 factor (ECF subfamily)